jgi:hypothetical protein
MLKFQDGAPPYGGAICIDDGTLAVHDSVFDTNTTGANLAKPAIGPGKRGLGPIAGAELGPEAGTQGGPAQFPGVLVVGRWAPSRSQVPANATKRTYATQLGRRVELVFFSDLLQWLQK